MNTVEASECKKQDNLFKAIKLEAQAISLAEPLLKCLLARTILDPQATTFNDIVATTISHRLSTLTGCRNSSIQPDVCPNTVKDMISSALSSDEMEMGCSMSEAVRHDAEACVRRDPACESVLEAILYFKGFAALVCHRAARRHWKKELNTNKGAPGYTRTKHVALWLQSQASAAFGVDIHPAAQIGAGVMFDHGTGIVIGETAVIGSGCTLLHGVTLGGTGKESGDRHPKVGKDVLIGAGASILGNIRIGDSAKIGSGAIVLKAIPNGATAVGSPARIIGWASEKRPGSTVDIAMMNVDLGESKRAEEDASNISLEDDGIINNLDRSDPSAEAVVFDDDEIISIQEAVEYFCPFKQITRRASLDSHSIVQESTFRILSASLKQENCDDAVISEVYAALLRFSSKKNYVTKETLLKELSSIIMEKTNLQESVCDALSRSVVS